MVRYTDHLVGRLVDALDELEIRKRTIVIFTTDNGTSGGIPAPSAAAAQRRQGRSRRRRLRAVYRQLSRAWSRRAWNRRADRLHRPAADLCELAGAAAGGLPIDGMSLRPLILGKADDRRATGSWPWATGPRLDADGVRGKHDFADRVIRDKRYKVWVRHRRADHRALRPERGSARTGQPARERARTDVRAAIARFQAVVDSTPDRDARPSYRPRARNSWDRRLPTASPAE